MKKLLLRSVLFLLIGLPPAMLLSELSLRYPASFSEFRTIGHIENALHDPASVRALAVGNSHARAIDFRVLGIDGEKLGLAWNDMFEVQHQLEVLVPRFPNLEVVFVGIAYFSFHWDNEATGDPDVYLRSRRIFNGAAPGWRKRPGDVASLAAGRAHLLVRSDAWVGVGLGLLGKDPSESWRARHQQRMTEPHDGDFLEEHAERRAHGKLTLVSSMMEADPALVDRTAASLSETIRFLQDRGIEVILFTPPYSRQYTARFISTGLIQEMQREVRALQAAHAVPWFDFSRDSMANKPWRFRDSDHVNFAGQAVFSEQLLAAICAKGGAPLASVTRHASTGEPPVYSGRTQTVAVGADVLVENCTS